MLIEGCYNLKEKCLYSTLYKCTCKSVSPLVYSLEVFFLPEVVKIFSQINISVILQSQIIQKHLHVDYNPLKRMLVLISSLKLSIVP